MKTERLFYENVDLKEFNGKVLSCVQQEGTFRVILDRTAFYPEGGGQPAEGGYLDGVKVIDVQEDGDEIVHILEEALTVGDSVQGIIDYERRFQLMQQHSGEHIVSGMIHRRFGYDNVGFHMGSDFITIDLNGMITAQELAEIEMEVNQYIWTNQPVNVFYPQEEERESLAYRSKKELTGQVRLVEFPGADLCACCGLHVKNTGEIGLVKLISAKKFRDGVRIEMLCGKDAFVYLNQHYLQNSQIAVSLSVKGEESFAAVQKQSKEILEQKNIINTLKQTGYLRLAQSCQGKGNVLVFEDALDAADLRRCADKILDTCQGICVLLSGNDQDGYKYAIGERDGDVRTLVKEVNQALEGRGGGKPFFAQGSLKAGKNEISRFFSDKDFLEM